MIAVLRCSCRHRSFVFLIAAFFLNFFLATEAANYTIATVSKLGDSPFFALVGEGCDLLADLVAQRGEDALECIYEGPPEASALLQADVIQRLLDRGIDGLAVSPLDTDIIGEAINRAVDLGIPVVTFDSDAPDSRRSISIGTNDVEIGHALAWLLSSTRPGGGRFAVISSNVKNVHNRVDGMRFKLQDTFPGNNWVEHGRATDCEDNIELSLDQAFELGNDPQIDAIVSVGGWPMFNPIRWKQFVDEHPHLLLFVVDSLPVQLDLLEEGYVDALVGQRPLEMGLKASDYLYSILSDPQFTPPFQIFTGHEVFFGNRESPELDMVQKEDNSTASSSPVTSSSLARHRDALLSTAILFAGLIYQFV